MKIECPHCEADNKIEFAENITCKECEKSFKGFKFSKRKLVSAGSALIIGTASGYAINNKFQEERYPLEVEYAIVDTCVNSSKSMVSVSWYENKRDTCLCTLRKTEQDIPYSDYKSDEAGFISSFRHNARSCS